MIHRHPANRLGLAVAAMAISLAATTAHAAILYPTHDGSIREGSANTAIDGGTGEHLYVRKDNDASNNNVRKAYVKFDLTGLNVDLTQPATLTMTVSYRANNQNGNRAFYFYGLNSGYTPTTELGTDWSESALTWNNAPGNDRTTDIDNGFVNSTLIQTFSNQYNTDVGQVFTISIADLSDFIQNDNTVTFMASWSDTVQYGFGSKENSTAAYRPTLDVSVIPEPASAALLAVVVSLVVTRRPQQSISSHF